MHKLVQVVFFLALAPGLLLPVFLRLAHLDLHNGGRIRIGDPRVQSV